MAKKRAKQLTPDEMLKKEIEKIVPDKSARRASKKKKAKSIEIAYTGLSHLGANLKENKRESSNIYVGSKTYPFFKGNRLIGWAVGYSFTFNNGPTLSYEDLEKLGDSMQISTLATSVGLSRRDLMDILLRIKQLDEKEHEERALLCKLKNEKIVVEAKKMASGRKNASKKTKAK